LIEEAVCLRGRWRVGVVRDEGGPRSEAAARGVGTVPPGPEFGISSRRLTNGTWLVAVSGEVDLYTAPELDRALASSVTAGARRLVVDLSAATFVDSTALHVLLRAARQLDGKEGELIVAAPDPNVRRVFGITGFDRLFSTVFSLSDVSVLS
jgi:anti-sigma B factor antagonist